MTKETTSWKETEEHEKIFLSVNNGCEQKRMFACQSANAISGIFHQLRSTLFVVHFKSKSNRINLEQFNLN